MFQDCSMIKDKSNKKQMFLSFLESIVFKEGKVFKHKTFCDAAIAKFTVMEQQLLFYFSLDNKQSFEKKRF
jgi:hypothetical protein